MPTSTIVTIVAALLIVWLLYKQFTPVKGLHQLNDAAFKKKLDESGNKQLVDVREPHEFKNGHIPGAVNVPLSQFSSRIKDISSNKEVFLYCQSGMRSKQAARQLLKNGFSDVTHLVGGISAWSGKKTK